MKEFYGSVSLTGRVSFLLEAEDEETAENIVFGEIEGIELTLKDGSTIEVTEIEWDLIKKSNKGNVEQSHIGDFEIYEEN